MPDIEIISVRFNLAKEDDRRLFEMLQKRSDAGKRNEFIKQALLECLKGDHVSGKTLSRPSKIQPKKAARAEPDTSQQTTEIAGTATVASSNLPSKPVDEPCLSPIPERDASTVEPDHEAAGLVGSFVQ